MVPLIPALRGGREFKATIVCLQSEFQYSQGYMEKPYLENKKHQMTALVSACMQTSMHTETHIPWQMKPMANIHML